MSRFVKFFVCAFAVVALATASSAATIDFVLTTYEADNSWELTAEASQGDNGGIAGVNVTLVGLGSGGVMTANAPKAVDATGFFPKGFTVGNGNDTTPGDQVVVFAGQVGGGGDLMNPNTILFGVGQQAFEIPNFIPGSAVGNPVAFPVVLAYGTGQWDTMTFLGLPVGAGSGSGGVGANGNVFDDQGAVGASSADTTATVVRVRDVIPEPASIAMLGVLFLGLIGLRKKLG